MSTVNRTNMYDITEYWLKNIAPKYFDLTDLSLNRAGLFGYVNEIQSHAIESIANENSILYDELFFKRAVLPQSIYAYASHYNVTNTQATAAVMSFALIIKEDTLLKKSITSNTNSYFIIDSDTEIKIEGEISFSLDYDIKVNIKKDVAGNYSYSAKYMMDSVDNPISTLKNGSNPFIKLSKIKMTDTYYIILYVDCHQVSKTVKNKVIYSDDFVEYFSFDIEDDATDLQIADFSVFYREPNASTFYQIDKLLIDSAAQEDPFCYYQFKDNNKVNISFSTISRYFRPKFNSELKFIFYNTNGAEGNFSYNGTNITVNLKSDIYDYRDVIMTANVISDSMGGADKLDYEGIKNQVSLMASTCNNIGTEIDLNKYFEAIDMNSRVKFVKKEDDIMCRIFDAFCMFTDSNKNLIPTNTLDLDLYDSDFDVIEESTKRYILKPGKKIIYQPNSRVAKVQSTPLVFEPTFSYMNPFTMVINKSPFFLEYFLSSINAEFVPQYSEVNDELFVNFIINSIAIKRNAIVENDYTITFSAMPNIEGLKTMFANFDPAGNYISDNKLCKFVGVFYDSITDEVSHYFDIEMISATKEGTTEKYFFEAKITTDDYVSVYSSLRMTNNVYALKDIGSKGTHQPLIDATQLKIGLIALLKDDSGVKDRFHSVLPNIDGYNMTNVFRISGTVNLITNMNRMMTSNLLYHSENKKLGYRIREVPLVKHEYLSITDYAEAFIKLFTSDYTVLKDNLDRLTNAFDLSIKFYNTYGKSYYFYVSEKTTNILDRVNLSIAFRIKLNPNKLSDSGLKEDIRKFINSYIEEINDDINLYISNLMKSLENNFSEISFINFKYINNYGSEVQSIEKNFPMLKVSKLNSIKEFVPEYLNMNKTFKNKYETEYDVLADFV